MKRWLLRIGLAVLIVALVFAAYGYYQARSLGFLRFPSYDKMAPTVPEISRPAILVFSKTGAFIHKEAIPAAESMFKQLAEKNGWSVYITENGAVHNAEDLARFEAVIWNNVTGNVLTEPQQQALIDYLESGGGWVGIHGAGDGSSDWAWYNQKLIGAKFIGHPMDPQFQRATIRVEKSEDVVVSHLGPEWKRTDEWYSFEGSPRAQGMTVLGNLDESTYQPRFFDKDIRMGKDHPIIWKHCPGRGRAFYSALGHSAESFSEPEHIRLLEQAVAWTAGWIGEHCSPATAPAEIDEESRLQPNPG